jgi:2-polyprenyl-3-methyl-5-hydroxy-6-metoxy-1,4-benzoquinol methylase
MSDAPQNGGPPPRKIQVDEVLRTLRARVQAELASESPSLRGEPTGAPEDWHFDGLPRFAERADVSGSVPTTLVEYTNYHDEDFVRHAYHGLLGREPDATGWSSNLSALRSGALSKVQILGRMRYSPEGRRRKSPVAGLLPRFLADQAMRVPVLGYVLKLGVAIARLPSEMNQPARLEAYVNHGFTEWSRRLDDGFGRVEQALRELEQVTMPRREALEGLETFADRLREIAREKAGRTDVDALAQGQSELGTRQSELAERQLALGEAQAELSVMKADAVGLVELESMLRGPEFGLRLETMAQRMEAMSTSRADEARVRAERDRGVAATLRELEADFGRRLHEIETRELVAVREELDDARGHFGRVDEQLGQHRLALAEDRHRVGLLLEEARRRLPKPIAEAEILAMVSEQEHLHDSMYSSLEDRFRGTRPEVTKRLSTYLPLVAEAMGRTAGARAVDLGCGRGEWLELMRQEAVDAVGVDLNRTMVVRCADAELSAVESGAIEYLRDQPPRSAGVVTAFHLLEHLPFRDLLSTLDESVRVLRPGGIAIFETPNPENLLVGATGFYADPTHRNPLFPPTLQFLLEQRGFVDVEILRPYPRTPPEWMEPLPEGDPLAERLNPLLELLRSLLQVSPDFAVVGRKA